MFNINENDIPYPYERFRARLKEGESFAVTGLTTFLRLFLLSKIKKYSKKKVLMVTSTEQNALKYQSDLKTIFDLDADIMPFQDVSMYETVSPNLYDYARQVEILLNKPNVVICPVKSLLEKFPNEDFFKKNCLKIKVGDTLDLGKFSRQLVNLGYKKVTMVSDISEFSIRGDIADVFSLNSHPVRIELWGDEVVDIRYFDNETQKSVEKAKETTIYPVYKFITAGQEDLVRELQDELDDDIPEENYFEGIEVYQGYFNRQLTGILDYFKDYVLVFDEATEIYSKYEFLDEECEKRKEDLLKYSGSTPHPTPLPSGEGAVVNEFTSSTNAGEGIIQKLKTKLKTTMWQNVGIFRDENSLNQALKDIEQIEKEFNKDDCCANIEEYELRNMLITSKLIAKSALQRKESRGAHYRTDFLQTDKTAKHSEIKK